MVNVFIKKSYSKIVVRSHMIIGITIKNVNSLIADFKPFVMTIHTRTQTHRDIRARIQAHTRAHIYKVIQNYVNTIMRR